MKGLKQLRAMALIAGGVAGISVLPVKSAEASVQSDFVDRLKPAVQTETKKYNLYASVQMAQAALESAWGQSTLSTNANNYFGIKGSYNGAYVNMNTAEYDSNGNLYYVVAQFKKYPSAFESMEDNASLLRNGLSWNSAHYSGTWKENAKTYADAANSLTGRYATDPVYGSKLINLIQSNGWDALDAQEITVAKTESVSFTTNISSNGDAFYRISPYGVHGNQRGDSLNQYNGQAVYVDSMQTLSNGQVWYGGYVNGSRVWIYSGATNGRNNVSSVDKYVKVTNGGKNDSYFTNGAYQFMGSSWGKTLYDAGLVSNMYLHITKQITVNGITWYLYDLNGKTIWIAASAVSNDNATIKSVNYAAQLKDTSDVAYYDKPWEYGTSPVFNVKDYKNTQFIATGETTTMDGTTWVRMTYKNKTAWVNKAALKLGSNITASNFKFAITASSDSYFTGEPYQFMNEVWGKTFKSVGWTNRIMNVTKTMTAPNGVTWYGGNMTGTSQFIWVAASTGIKDTTSAKTVDYTAKVNGRSGDNAFYDSPWEYGTSQAVESTKLSGKSVRVTAEWVTPDGVKWNKIAYNGRTAWIIDRVLSKIGNVQSASVTVLMNKPNDSYFTNLPYSFVGETWGTTFSAAGYYMQTLNVTTQMKDARGETWYGGTVSGKNSGFIWVAASATVKDTSGATTADYTARVNSSNVPDTVYYDKPWEYGTAEAVKASALYGKNLLVTGTWRTMDGVTWAKVQYNGRPAWINTSVISNIGNSNLNPNIKVTIKRGGDSYFTGEPYQYLNEKWGTTFDQSSMTNKAYSVSKIMYSTNGVKWYQINVNGELRWVAASATDKN
ncbi:hypothetical protein EFL81_00940 [Weissella confusa]|uniref:glucosaminidase domain-containing protein n=1 Tax=Weissella confusa TaxID=1583 RepID=UPI00223BB09C|nr:glucosaminidase domain-containing protein [Weissella confusa]MCS9995466.1 hypothetical protein [Weissella confusa]